MMVADDERGARRQAPVLNIPNDRFSVSADSTPDGDNDEQAFAPTPSESTQDRRRGWCTPMHVVYALVAICAVVGAVVGVVITVQYNNLDDNKPSRTDVARPDNSTTRGDKGGAATESPNPVPATSSSVVRFFALGSWGADPLFEAKLDGRYQYHDETDRTAQTQVASAMALAAEQGPTPQLILSQGNNFNWYGLLPPSKQERSIHARVNASFTSKYSQASLASIPWAVIIGEHDVGGGRFLCGATEATLHACGNEHELVAGLRHKLASQYGPRVSSTSVNTRGSQKKGAKAKLATHSHDEVADTAGVIQDPRWTLHDQYHKQRLESADGQVSIDVFHVNVLVGSALSICCQCIGYAPPKRAAAACAAISSKDHYCAGGNYALYKSCRAELSAMADDSLAKLRTDVAESNATFKIINGHVSPWALDTTSRKKWMDVVANGKVHLWLHATTPAMTHAKATASRRLKERHTKKKHGKHVQHDDGEGDDAIGAFVSHFVANGVGGGVPIQFTPPAATDDSAATVVWSLTERKYGFLDIRATSTSLRVQLRTTDASISYCVDIDRDSGVDASCNMT